MGAALHFRERVFCLNPADKALGLNKCSNHELRAFVIPCHIISFGMFFIVYLLSQ
jgi:hypothetical protein